MVEAAGAAEGAAEGKAEEVVFIGDGFSFSVIKPLTGSGLALLLEVG